MSKQKSCLG